LSAYGFKVNWKVEVMRYDWMMLAGACGRFEHDGK
jgi:hypothetical protein